MLWIVFDMVVYDGTFDMMWFFFKQKTAYDMRISDWSSDVCSSDLSWRRAGRSDCRRVESPRDRTAGAARAGNRGWWGRRRACGRARRRRRPDRKSVV